MKTIGQIAFEAWRDRLSCLLRRASSRKLIILNIEYDELEPPLRDAWEAAAEAIAQEVSPVIH